MRYRMREAAAGVSARWTAARPQLNERTQRLTAAAEARAIGRGGGAVAHDVTGLSKAIIIRGRRDLDAAAAGTPPGIVRPRGRPPTAGGHRPTLGPDRDQLGQAVTRGDPCPPCCGPSRVPRRWCGRCRATDIG